MIARFFALIACLAALAAPAAALAKRSAPPATVLHTIAGPQRSTLLNGRIGDRDGVFLFDTGGGVTIVTPDAAKAAGCKPWGQITGFRATGERLDSLRCDDVHVTLGGSRLDAPSASVLDLNALVNSKEMPTLSGLVALDLFAGKTITIRPLAHEVVVETPASLKVRVRHGREIPVRLVRDAEGLALTVDAAVPTPSGRAWMELDTGNLGPVMVGRHAAPALGLSTSDKDPQQAHLSFGGNPVEDTALVSDLIMDGDIGASVLKSTDLTLDLATGRAWLKPASAEPTR